MREKSQLRNYLSFAFLSTKVKTIPRILLFQTMYYWKGRKIKHIDIIGLIFKVLSNIMHLCIWPPKIISLCKKQIRIDYHDSNEKIIFIICCSVDWWHSDLCKFIHIQTLTSNDYCFICISSSFWSSSRIRSL